MHIFNSSPLHSPHHHNYSSAAAPANLNDDEESDGVDVDVLGEAEEKGENSGEDHPHGQEVSEVDSLRDVAAENKNKISESGYETRTFGQFFLETIRAISSILALLAFFLTTAVKKSFINQKGDNNLTEG